MAMPIVPGASQWKFTLRPSAATAAEQRLAQLCDGSIDELARRLEHAVLHAARSPKEVIFGSETRALLQCIADLASYDEGEDDACHQMRREGIPALLTRFISLTLKYGSAIIDDTDEHGVSTAAFELLLRTATEASTNCAGGVVRHLSMLLLTAERMDIAHDAQRIEASIGFSDYAAAETAARLWSGAVVLSLVALERSWPDMWLNEGSQRSQGFGDGPLRIIEIGCGPGLVSVVLDAAMRRIDDGRRDPAGQPALRIDITDISPDAIREVQASLARNLAHSPSLDGACRRHAVDAFVLDFDAVPDTLCGVYDMVLATDIVYDFALARLVPGALARLLKPNGRAVLCCESHRDGMQTFVSDVEERFGSELRCVALEPVAKIRSPLPPRINGCCTLMMFERLPPTLKATTAAL